MILDSPLFVQYTSVKKFYLNLNAYRNANYHVLNTVKKNYKAIMSEQILKLDKMDKIEIRYVLYPKTKRLVDIDNVISIHKKFFQDALVELGKLPDDNYLHIIGSSESFGDVDKSNPRVEIIIIQH